jgi:3-oxoacyl-[acyl-carrier protein] reductase
VTDGQRVVIVTGASRGIGAACAAAFAASGAQVVGLSRSEVASSDAIDHRSVDLLDAAAVEAAFDNIENDYGRIDVLVANAGITKDQLSIRMSDDEFAAVIDTNLTASFRVMRRALRRMVRQRSGSIVVISSIGALMGIPGQANYAAAKAGLIGMARAMAREVASRSITINVVAPGLIETDMTAALGEEALGGLTSQVPAGRMGRANEVASVVEFLASPGAAYMTGAIVAVDGGLGMGL